MKLNNPLNKPGSDDRSNTAEPIMTDTLQKTCNNCDKTRPAADFYENPFSPDGLYSFCKSCFDEFVGQGAPEGKIPVPPPLSDEKSETPDTPETTTPHRKTAPAPSPQLPPSTAKEFDFIKAMIGPSEAEKRMGFELLQFPRQITKIPLRKRICSGCGKVEAIDEVEKHTVVPVHAWFCGLCRDRGVRRRVIKGMTVHDYWGREFTVKKWVSREMVLGVLKNKEHPWNKKKQKIYGSWETP